MKRRDLLQCLGLTPVAIGVIACEAERSSPDSGSALDSGVGLDAKPADDASTFDDASIMDSGFEDAAVSDAGQHAGCSETGADLQGPFYRAGAPTRTTLVDANEPGTKLEITGHVIDADCESPIRGAMLDVWQADDNGAYDNVSVDYRLRAIMASDQDGVFRFTSIKPANYLDAGGWRPAHIHFTVTHPDYPALTTQLYFAGDPYLAPNDSCDPCASEDPTLIIELVSEMRNGVEWLVGHFDVILRSN